MTQNRRRTTLLVRSALVTSIIGSLLALGPVTAQARLTPAPPAVTPVEVRGPSLPLTPFVPLAGDLPSTTVDSGGAPLGAIRTLAAAGSWAVPPVAAEGQVLSSATYPDAASVLGAAFGGDGTTTFGVPDLRGRTVNGVGTGPGLSPVTRGEQLGSSQATVTRAHLPVSYGGSGTAFVRRQPALGLTYLIRTSGRDASYSAIGFDAMGVVIPYGGTVIPAGWMAAEGQLLTIADHAALYGVLGTTYGGDGATTFALPDLRGRTAVGTGCGLGMPSCRTLGQVFGSEAVTLTTAELPTAIGGGGQPGSNDAPSLALNQLCVLYGIFPSSSATTIDPVQPFVSEVILYAGRFPTDYDPPCAGQLLSISQNSALFALVGTSYGGDGRTNFGLPDLRGRSAIGQGPGIYVGWWYGWTSFYLTTANLPAPEVPTAPTIGTAVRGDQQATVSWTAPVSNGGTPVTGYRVTPYISGVAQTPVVFAGDTATSQTLTGLTNGLSYRFTVAAINAVSTGAESALSKLVRPATLPGAPTSVAGVAGDASVTLSWLAPADDGGSLIRGYVVTPYISGVAQTPVVLGDARTTRTLRGLMNGTEYTFTVRARNKVGLGPESAPSEPVTPA